MSKILIKLGSSSITDSSGIATSKLENILSDVVALANEGHELAIVSSGAIAIGKHHIQNYNKALIHSQQAA
ncbi:MAG: hypothetical protein KDD37_09545, partial [Bdellovibrionales bacterium]|nr:hypothetical protein [Bdellovibrionales bacterium]